MPCARTNSRTALCVVAVFSDSAGTRWSKIMTIFPASQTLGTPISAKLLRTRSAFSWDMARSTWATTISSGATRLRPAARARIFSAIVIPMGNLLRHRFGLAGQVLVFEFPILRQADESGVLFERGEASGLAGQEAAGRAAQIGEEIHERFVRHHDRGHGGAGPGHAQAGQFGNRNQLGFHARQIGRASCR